MVRKAATQPPAETAEAFKEVMPDAEEAKKEEGVLATYLPLSAFLDTETPHDVTSQYFQVIVTRTADGLVAHVQASGRPGDERDFKINLADETIRSAI